MTKPAEDVETKELAATADPNLLIQVLDGQHRPSNTYMTVSLSPDQQPHEKEDCRLSGSAIPKEIQRSLLKSDPLTRGL